MRSAPLVLLLCPLLGASALAQTNAEPIDTALRHALTEQHQAEAQTARLDQVAARAQGQADRLHAQQAAAAQAIDAAEARITAADVRLRLATAFVTASQQRLAAEQAPAASLLAGLATMARRPPLLVLADRGGPDELVKVRLLLDSTLPLLRARTTRLAGQIAERQQFRRQALAARTEQSRSRAALVTQRQRYATLEQQAMAQALTSGGQALGAGDSALAAQENVEQLRGEQSNGQSIRRVAAQLAAEPPSPISPFMPEGRSPRAPFAYRLPTNAPVTEGLSSVNQSGVRSRGLSLATARGAPIIAPGDGIVTFAGPYRDYDGLLIIDHGGGWLSLVVNVGSTLHRGDRIRLGDSIGRALGPLLVELSHNGRQISPALMAGSSQSLSNKPKGG